MNDTTQGPVTFPVTTTTRTVKQVAPWNLKPGMKLVPLTQSWDGKPYALGTITEVAKRRAHFTGGNAWHVKTDIGETLQYFGKDRAGKAERVRVYANVNVEAGR